MKPAHHRNRFGVVMLDALREQLGPEAVRHVGSDFSCLPAADPELTLLDDS